jgi:hypothetical protein
MKRRNINRWKMKWRKIRRRRMRMRMMVKNLGQSAREWWPRHCLMM